MRTLTLIFILTITALQNSCNPYQDPCTDDINIYGIFEAEEINNETIVDAMLFRFDCTFKATIVGSQVANMGTFQVSGGEISFQNNVPLPIWNRLKFKLVGNTIEVTTNEGFFIQRLIRQ